MNIAIIGASNNPEKFGNKAVRAYKKKGWNVSPVNPKELEVEGLKCFRSVLDIPNNLDVVSLYLPPTVSLGLVKDIVKKHPKMVYLNPGSESDELFNAFLAAGIEPIMACSIQAIGIKP